MSATCRYTIPFLKKRYRPASCLVSARLPRPRNCIVVAVRPLRSHVHWATNPPGGRRAPAASCGVPMRLVQVPALVLLAAPAATGHGATSFPLPRNAIDGDTPPWSGPVPKTSLGGAPFQGWCPMPSNSTKDGRHLSGRNGQACFWFSCVIHPAARDLTRKRWRRPSVSFSKRRPPRAGTAAPSVVLSVMGSRAVRFPI